MGKGEKRISYIAQAQLIGCLLVVLGHSIPLNWNVPNLIYNTDVFIYTFHMPLFFFISGFLFEKTNSVNRYNYASYLKKRTVKMMLPYVVLTLVGFVPKILLGRLINDESSFSIKYFIECFLIPRQNVWGHFWFLPTLLIISAFAFFFSKLKASKFRKVFYILVVVLFGLSIISSFKDITDWFAINDVIKFTCYYALGVLFGNSSFEKLIEDRRKNRFLLLLLPISIGLFVVDFDNAFLTGFIRMAIGIFMVIFVLIFSQLFNITSTKIGKFLTRNTYPIFILSWPFQSIVSLVFESKLGLVYYVTMPIAFFVGICGPVATIIAVDWIEKKIGKKVISPVFGG